MKKTLKVIASAAIAMSAFASVAMADDAATTTSTTTTDTSATTTAPAKTSADFTDLANVDAGLKAKIDALLKAGVFEGVSDNSFGIDQNMTRAQFAKVLDLIYNVNVDMTVKTSSFADVKADDQANGWAIPYIEAAKKAGLIDGKSDTSFDPGANVTIGEFATALVKGLGVKPDVTGTPWYADAVKQAIAKNVLPADADGSKVATRADLVVGAYGGQQAYQDANKPAAVSVVSAKATGVHTVTVTFDRDVDATKATLSLTKGSVAINTTTKFADDNKSATLTLTDTKIMAGDYTVTLGGLDASAIKTATGTFTAQDEQVQKIEFVTASDTIAYSTKSVVKIKATNQYGELASASAGNYDYYGGYVQKLTKDADGYLLATVDAKTNTTQGVSVIPITITNSDSHVTATKNFTVGTAPIPSKVELGTPVYSNGTSLSGSGDNVKFPLNLYDQYGSIIPYDVLTTDFSGTPPTIVWSDYLGGSNAETHTIEDDGNNMPLLKIALNTDIDKAGDYKFTVIEQAASTTGTISVKSSKVATKIEIGDLGDVIAAGDVDAYIPVIAYDADGNQLSVDDIVSDTNSSDDPTTSRIKVSGGSLQRTGEHRGTIKVSRAAGQIPMNKNGVVTVTAYIATSNVSSTSTKSYTVQAARIPDHFLEVTKPAEKAVAGSFNKFKYQIVDQYGKVLDNLLYVDSNGNASTTQQAGYNEYSVSVTANTYDASSAPVAVTAGSTALDDSTAIVTSDNDLKLDGSYTPVAVYGNNTVKYVGPSAASDFNKHTLRFYTGKQTQGYKVDFIADIQKNGVSQNKIDKSINVINSGSELDNLTYSLNTVPALWNAEDSDIVADSKPDGTTVVKTAAQQLQADSKLGREVTLTVKSGSGDTVAVPRIVYGITSSNPQVAKVYYDSTNHRGYVRGNEAGTANIAVTYLDAKGNYKTITAPVTVKSDPLTATKVAWDHNSFNTATTFNAFGNLGTSLPPVNTGDAKDAYLATFGLTVTDSYGQTYSKGDARIYDYLLGVTFSISHQSDEIAGVTIDPDGTVHVTLAAGKVSGTFDLTATTPSGQSATTTITAYATPSAPNFSW